MTGDKFTHTIHNIAKFILKFLVVVMTLSLGLGMINLVYTLVHDVIVPPYQYMLELHELYNVFKLGLIIVVGYELIKSLLIIINSDSIPSKTILNIAIIAVANKIITLDLSHTGFESVLALAALALALGVGNYFLKEDIIKKDKEA